MLLVVLLILASALGMAGVGRSSGDYVRRQVTADAVAESASGVFQERLRHIGRLQERAMQDLAAGETEKARAEAAAALGIAERTWEAVQAEAGAVAVANGASRWEVGGVPQHWFERIPSEDPEIEWVGLARKLRIEVVIGQRNADGVELRAEASARVPPVWPPGPILGEGKNEP